MLDGEETGALAVVVTDARGAVVRAVEGAVEMLVLAEVALGLGDCISTPTRPREESWACEVGRACAGCGDD